MINEKMGVKVKIGRKDETNWMESQSGPADLLQYPWCKSLTVNYEGLCHNKQLFVYIVV